MPSQQSTRWCFTVNNWTMEDFDAAIALEYKYLVMGREVGAEGTEHLQGFVVLKAKKTLSAMKECLPRAHFEVARGSNEQASEYCKKDGSFEEYGEMPSKSSGGDVERERWVLAKEAAKRGDFDAVPEDIYFRYYRTMKEIAKDNMQKPDDLEGVCGVWIYGPPGTGKSYYARSEYPGAYLKMQNKWWDGYQGEDYVILDDFDSKELGHLLKIWLDRYSFLAETKGGAIHIRPKKIIITSNYAISDLQWDDVMEAAVKRRCHVIHKHLPYGS